ncbi:MAG TPA: ATP-binding protein [Spirochaetota bacterium]|nr:response regulator [Spirochaetota bacterium]HOD16819.1 ATP-binding protein [Spirochaetota bacterium]HPN11110.1 ATP-binding protein [Spirochaetota bacterium]
MNMYLFIPLASVMTTFFLWSYIFITKRKSSAGKAYLLFCGTMVCWGLADMVYVSVTSLELARVLFRALSPLYLSSCFLFLNFTYALTGKKRDIPFYFFLASLGGGIILVLFTDLFIDITHLSATSRGLFPPRGDIYEITVLLLYIFPVLYSLAMLAGKLVTSKDTVVRKQYALVIAGTLLSVILSVLDNVIASYYPDKEGILNMAPPFVVVQSLFVFIAITRYRFLTMSIQHIADDLFSLITDAVIILDNDRNIIEMNAMARELLDYPEDRPPNPRADDIFPEGHLLDEGFQTREVTLFSHGRRTTLLITQSPLIQHNTITGRLVIIRDISDRKLAEDLMRSQHEIGAALSGVSDMRHAMEIIVNTVIRIEGTDSGGVYLLDGQSQYFDLIYSRGFSKNFVETAHHFSKERPHPAADLFTRTEPFYINAGMIKALPRGRVLEEEGLRSLLMIPVLHRERPISWLVIGSHGPNDIPLPSQTTAEAVASQIGNAIARFKAEEELLKTSKIESLGIFAGGIAHDFNNLLTSIIGNISLAKLDASKDSVILPILTEAENASLRAKDLTIQLLTFSKGGEPIRKTESILEILKETTDFVLRGANITCRFYIAADLKYADIDRGQIGQVIHNIILNARQAMPSGGLISITAENIALAEASSLNVKPGEYVKISIADQGIGIPTNYLSKIFDPYFTTKAEGSGLGLAVSYSIIKNHEGCIAVKSEPGKGTAFDLYIPASDREPEPAQSANRQKKEGTFHILLMDDEQMILDVGERILTRMGHRVQRARNGEEAIELYRNASASGDGFDLVIMDLTIPGGKGGSETIGDLKVIDPDVRAIVSSGYSNNPVMANFREYGFCGVIVKPYRYDDLKHALEECVR